MSTASKTIELYADGPNLNEINKDFGIQIDGYTFNPSLFKKNGAKDYLNYCKQILEICPDKPISFEVFSDDENGMIRQAEILNNLGKNIYVKIPISYTSGDSTAKVIQNLVHICSKFEKCANSPRAICPLCIQLQCLFKATSSV